MMLFNYPDSLSDCESSLALDGENVKVLGRKAKIHVINGDFDAAEAAYAAVLSRDASSASALKESREIPVLKNRFKLAGDCLGKFEASGQKIEGRQAVAQLDIVLATCPQYKEAKLVRCLALGAAGRTDEAFSQTTSLMRSGMTNSSELLYVRARCLYNMSQLDEAVQHLRQLLQRDPDHKKAFAEMKRLRQVQKDKTAADAAYKGRDFETAIAKYTEVIEATVDNIMFRAKLYNNRATAHSNLRQHEQCVADCGRAIELDGNYGKAYMKRANTLIILGEPKQIEDAIRDYEK
jgi:tetratricopeptide (TPR) repeat protein